MMATLVNTFWPLFSAPLWARALVSLPGPDQQAPSDEELVEHGKGGDPRALQELYQRHADRVYRRLTHLVGQDPEREDLLQEVFVALFQGLKSFRGDASLNTFLFRIVANKAYDHLKRRRRRASRTYLTGTSEQMPCAEPSPERQARGSEKAALLWRCLDQLKPKKRIAFVLRVVEGQSLKEISEQVDASVYTVAQRIRHAKKELVELVRQHEEDGQ